MSYTSHVHEPVHAGYLNGRRILCHTVDAKQSHACGFELLCMDDRVHPTRLPHPSVAVIRVGFFERLYRDIVVVMGRRKFIEWASPSRNVSSLCCMSCANPSSSTALYAMELW